MNDIKGHNVITGGAFNAPVTFNVNGQDCVIEYSKFCFDSLDDTLSGTSSKDLYGRLGYVKSLYDTFFDENYKKKVVSVVAMGGLGKTAFAHIYKKEKGNQYANIYHTYINNNLYDNFVEKMKSLIGNVAFDNAIDTYKSVEEKKKKIIQVLNDIPTGPNLLVLDINIKKGFSTDFFNDTFFQLNDKWHVLVLSRRSIVGLEKCRFRSKFDSLSGEPDEAVKMFRAISGVPDTICGDDDLKKIFSIATFDYHPLLIETLATYCRNHKNEVWTPDAIRSAIDISKSNETISPEMRHLNEGECDDDEELKYVYQYMKRMISFDDYSPNCQTILRHFILWPYDYIPSDVVETLLSGYGIKSLQGDLDSLVNNMVLDPAPNLYRLSGLPLETFLDAFPKNIKINEDSVNFLRSNNIPVVSVSGYRMHEILKETLCDKALEEKTSFDYSPYLMKVRKILKIERAFSSFLPYHECIAKTIDYNGKLLSYDEFVILLAGHFDYIVDNSYRRIVYNEAVDIIQNRLNYNVDDSVDNLDRLAVAMHDFSLVLIRRDEFDVAVNLCEKIVEIRITISQRRLSDDAMFKNNWRLAMEYNCLCHIADKRNDLDQKTKYAKDGIRLLSNDKVAEDYLLKYMLLGFDHNNEKLYNAVKNYINSPKCRLSDKYVPIPVMEDIGDCKQMGIYPVTQFQWDWVMGDRYPSVLRCDIRRGLGPAYPMYMVSWYEAVLYCNKLSVLRNYEEVYDIEFDANNEPIKAVEDLSKHGYRLPLEDEWQKVASFDGKFEKYSGTDDDDKLKDYAWYEDNSGATTHEVGTRQPNGKFYDMTGNVWEWCQNLYDASGASRVLRGGSWDDNADDCRGSYRDYGAPDFRYDDFGFRLLLSSPKKEKI